MWGRVILALVSAGARLLLSRLRVWYITRKPSPDTAFENAPIDRTELEKNIGDHRL